ncbi:hypothetical protein, conserved in T. vivax [Trypanosoma vivax Y486]|uniref:Uncharacterized protein n=1 Tax=Trypanosoma vivax (strain Y486) TaxID=1055687 RepID=F9WRC7_TRYVY|nr:hypothetical protein, conserved in T. vivax [Trypanosoma vivax Y486]|eukprot:CCD20111.1 hypothetical protein, conserved in T. vivax [Trypanosoma vivax Y486]
MQTQALRG